MMVQQLITVITHILFTVITNTLFKQVLLQVGSTVLLYEEWLAPNQTI